MYLLVIDQFEQWLQSHGADEGPELVNAAERIVRVADRYTSHWDRNENGAGDSDPRAASLPGAQDGH